MDVKTYRKSFFDIGGTNGREKRTSNPTPNFLCNESMTMGTDRKDDIKILTIRGFRI